MTDELKSQPTEEPDAGESCGTSSGGCPSCGGGKLLLLLLVGLGVAYFFSNRASMGPAAPAAVAWVEDYDQGLAQAADKNQLVLLAFKASWCGPCRQMDNQVFAKQAAADALTGWVPVHIDVDKQEKLASQYDVSGVPTFVALLPDGKEIARVSGGLSMQEFASFIVSAEARNPTRLSSRE